MSRWKFGVQLGSSKQLEVVQLVSVLHDVALDLAAHRPCDEVLELTSHQESGIRDSLRSDTDMALFDHLRRSLLHFC